MPKRNGTLLKNLNSPGQSIAVQCKLCKWHGSVKATAMWEKYGDNLPFTEIPFVCTRCGAKGEDDIDSWLVHDGKPELK